MQKALPESGRLLRESKKTLEMYGINGRAGAQAAKGGKKAEGGVNTDNFGRQCPDGPPPG